MRTATVCSAMRFVQPWRVLGSRRETDQGLVACTGRVATTEGGLSYTVIIKTYFKFSSSVRCTRQLSSLALARCPCCKKFAARLI